MIAFIYVVLEPFWWSVVLVAFSAVYWSVVGWYERYLCLLTTVCACCRVHLPWATWPEATASSPVVPWTAWPEATTATASSSVVPVISWATWPKATVSAAAAASLIVSHVWFPLCFRIVTSIRKRELSHDSFNLIFTKSLLSDTKSSFKGTSEQTLVLDSEMCTDLAETETFIL